MTREPQFIWAESTRIGDPAARKARLLELAVFVFLISPSMALSFSAAAQKTITFDLIAVSTILRDLALVSLIAFFLWRNGEPVIRIGWTLRGAAREAFLGAVLFLPMTLIAGLVERVLGNTGLTTRSKSFQKLLQPNGTPELVLALILVVVVAVAEETIFRGYLILRFGALTRSPVYAAILSSAIFSIGHGYEGTAGVATVGIIGLALAAVYLWRGSLVAPIVMHFLQDFIAIVVAPLLAHGH